MLIDSILKFLVLVHVLFALRNEISIRFLAPVSYPRVHRVLEPRRQFQQATLYKLNA